MLRFEISPGHGSWGARSSTQVDEFIPMMDDFGVDEDPALALFSVMDSDGSGGVDFHEMVSLFYTRFALTQS